jgi:hypothetical protein
MVNVNTLDDEVKNGNKGIAEQIKNDIVPLWNQYGKYVVYGIGGFVLFKFIQYCLRRR